MANAKPRILHDGKDMMWSLLALLAIAAVVAGIAGSCSFGFSEGDVPKYDAAAGLRADAFAMDFPIREPQVPADWQANSGNSEVVRSGGPSFSNVNWVTGEAWVQLWQSNAAEDELVGKLGGDEVSGTGVREIGGHKWVTYADGKSTIWVADLTDVRIGIVSDGSAGPLDTLASALMKAKPLAGSRQ